MTRGRGWPTYTGPQLTEHDEERLMRGVKLDTIVREKQQVIAATVDGRLAGSAVARVEERRREAKARALAMANGEASSGILASGGNGHIETWTEEEFEAQSCRAYTPGDLCGGCPSCLSKQYPESFRTLTLAEAWEEGELRETIVLPACPVPHGEHSESCVACRGFEVVKLPVADVCECDGARKEHLLTGETVCARCINRGFVLGNAPCRECGGDGAVVVDSEGALDECMFCAGTGTWPQWLYDAVEAQVKANRAEHDAWSASVSDGGDPDVPF